MWLRVDDTAPLHPKFCRAGVAAAGWWLHALAYCNRGLTDGFIPAKDVMFISPFTSPEQTRELVEILVRERLLERQDDDFVMHDYLEYQLSREEVLALRAERIESGRKGGRNSGKSRRERAKQQLEAKAKQQVEAKAKHAANPLLSSPHTVVSCSSSGLPATNNTLEIVIAAAPAKNAGSPPTPSPKARIRFDPKTGVISGVEPSDLKRWQALAPAVDLRREILRAAEWLTNHPQRRRSNIAQYLTNWISGEQDRLAARPNNSHKPSSPVLAGLARYQERQDAKRTRAANLPRGDRETLSGLPAARPERGDDGAAR